MKYVRLHQLMLFIPLFLLGAKEQGNTGAIIIEGKVLEAFTHKPLDAAYIHIIQGEEETFTKKDGCFTLKSWQKLPLKCTIEHKNFPAKKILVKESDKNIVVYLANR